MDHGLVWAMHISNSDPSCRRCNCTQISECNASSAAINWGYHSVVVCGDCSAINERQLIVGHTSPHVGSVRSHAGLTFSLQRMGTVSVLEWHIRLVSLSTSTKGRLSCLY